MRDALVGDGKWSTEKTFQRLHVAWMGYCKFVRKKQRKPLEINRKDLTVSNDSHGKIKGSGSVTSCRGGHKSAIFLWSIVSQVFSLPAPVLVTCLCNAFGKGGVSLPLKYFNTILVSRFTALFDMCSSQVCIWSKGHCVKCTYCVYSVPFQGLKVSSNTLFISVLFCVRDMYPLTL